MRHSRDAGSGRVDMTWHGALRCLTSGPGAVRPVGRPWRLALIAHAFRPGSIAVPAVELREGVIGFEHVLLADESDGPAVMAWRQVWHGFGTDRSIFWPSPGSDQLGNALTSRFRPGRLEFNSPATRMNPASSSRRSSAPGTRRAHEGARAADRARKRCGRETRCLLTSEAIERPRRSARAARTPRRCCT